MARPVPGALGDEPLLADTSVWAAHLRGNDPSFARELRAGRVLMHPTILAELATLNLHSRAEVLHLMQALPAAAEASQESILEALSDDDSPMRGLGLSDVQLLRAAQIDGARFWSRDPAVATAADRLGLLA